MDPQNRIEVINKEQWRKIFPVEKTILYIGSKCEDKGDILLKTEYGNNVEPRHLQVIQVLGYDGYRLVNLSDREITFINPPSPALKPFSFVDVMDNAQIQLGDFELIFHYNSTITGNSYAYAPVQAQAGNSPIYIRLSLPRTELKPDEPIEGTLLVAHRHLRQEDRGVQFELEVQVDDEEFAECYELGAAPYLFPGAEFEVKLKLTHTKKSKPKSGKYKMTVRATAQAYPGESAEASQEIFVAPFSPHSLNWK